MEHFMYHALGLCGEAHPNLFNMTLAIILVGYISYKIKQYGEQNRTQ